MHILVTVFEPFGDYTVNPTQLIAHSLSQEAQTPPPLHLSTCQLAVEADTCVDQALRAYRDQQPDAMISLGLGHGEAIALERVAINIDDFGIPDNAGQRRIDAPIVPEGPVGYWSTLPLKLMLVRLHQAQIRAVISNSAGTYVCNHLFYAMQHHISQDRRIPYGFIHVPCLPEQVSAQDPAMPLPEMIKGIQVCLTTMADFL